MIISTGDGRKIEGTCVFDTTNNALDNATTAARKESVSTAGIILPQQKCRPQDDRKEHNIIANHHNHQSTQV
jgi:hypothetical protein